MASYIGRRKFLATLGGAAAMWPLAARAQQGERMRRIGVLMNTAADDPEGNARIAAVVEGLRDLGWIEGRNVTLDIHRSAATPNDIRKNVAEMIAGKPDIIMPAGSVSLPCCNQWRPRSVLRSFQLTCGMLTRSSGPLWPSRAFQTAA